MANTEVAVKAAEFGVIGLGVMGQNLALNIEDHGQSVAVWNMHPEHVDEFLQKNTGKKLIGTHALKEFVNSLEKPRRILMMIKAGPPVDEMLAKLVPLLAPGDIVIDGGNSFFKDTQRREAEMKQHQIRFFGMGVSGGEEGARYGPSIMPGGDAAAYEVMRSTLEAIAAKTDTGPCVTYVGPGGAGHFVKMVHNGIEYGDMQLIAEAYHLMRESLGISDQQMAEVFTQWNRGPMESYLVEITSQILTVTDPRTGNPLAEEILDKAGQKGTGKWTAQVALDLVTPIPTIAAAIDARVLSSMKEERVIASQKLRNAVAAKYSGDATSLISAIEQALYASKICSYAQGMSLIRAGSQEFNWNIKLREMARIWTGGCIIRARLLKDIMQAFDRQPALTNLLLDDFFAKAVLKAEKPWRHVVSTAVDLGIPIPAMSASLAYFDSYRAARLPQNLTQAQRDFFGAHTYERVDQPGISVHTDWQQLLKKGNQ